jgi:hypothetical protein
MFLTGTGNGQKVKIGAKWGMERKPPDRFRKIPRHRKGDERHERRFHPHDRAAPL